MPDYYPEHLNRRFSGWFFGTFLGALSKSEKKIHIYFILGLSHLEQEERNLFLKVTHLQASYAD